MRQWIQADDGAVKASGSRVPRKAIAWMPGIYNATDVPGFGYPEFRNDKRFTELLYRVRQWRISLDWHLTGTLHGDDADEVGSGIVETTMRPFLNERNLATPDFPLAGAQGGWVDTLECAITRTIGGVTEGFTDSNVCYLNLCAPLDTDGITPATTYTYRTDTELWLPRVQLSYGGAGFLLLVDTAADRTPPPDTAMITFNASFNGVNAETHAYIPDTMEVENVSLTIETIRWWSYTGQSDNRPIYDEYSGLVLPGRTPFTQVF